MESESAQPPLKICRHCSVASRTDSETCPACGRPYRRSLSRWWVAIPIVALAFGVGYGGRKLLEGDDDPPGIPIDTATTLQTGISRAEFDDRVDEEPTLTRTRGKGNREATCLFYPVEGEQVAVWQYCFRDDELVSSTPLAGQPPQG
jgi:hypothetical protein